METMKMMTADDFNPLQDATGPVEKKKKAYWVKFAIPFDIVDQVKAWKNRKKPSRKCSSAMKDSGSSPTDAPPESLPLGSDVI
jgi:hypothetical protein